MYWVCKFNEVRFMRTVACLALSLFAVSCAGYTLKRVKPVLGESHWSSFDGKEMPWRRGSPVKNEKLKAVVITIHGLSGAASDFWKLEQDWPKIGIAVYGLQLRGQGNDPVVKRRGDIPSSKVWGKDLLTFHRLVRDKYPDKPVFWYAESLGTLIALHSIAEFMQGDEQSMQPAGIILASPIAGLRYRPTGFREFVIHSAVLAVPWMKVSLKKLARVDDKKIRVTHDTTFEKQMQITPHYVPAFTLRLLGQIDEMIIRSKDAAKKIHVPVLMLGSPNDVIANEDQIQRLFDAIPSNDKTLHWYRQSYHLLLHDQQRTEVMQTATAWVEKQAGLHK